MNRPKRSYFLIGIAVLAVSGWTSIANAQLLAVDWDSGNLYTVSTSNAALTLVGNTGITHWAEIQFSPSGTLYGFTVSPSQTLYTINPTTALATPVGSLSVAFVGEGGLAFAPNGTAYGAENTLITQGNTQQLFTINLATGHASVVGTIGVGLDINGLAYRSDGELIGLDRVTNALLVIDPTTAAATQLAAVPSTVGAAGGMTVLNGVGYYCTSGPVGTAPGSNTLYSFDLFSGASTPIGNFNGTITGTGISGLAARPVPEPSTFALAALGAAALYLVRRVGAHRKAPH